MREPLLLAIESATADASVALLRGEALVAERRVAAGRPASEALLPALLALLDESGLALAALDAFAVSVGPGSFTGLRVGVSTVKGLAFASDEPVLAVPTLAALALRARPEGSGLGSEPLVAALLDARRGEVYAALYCGDPADPPRVGPSVLRPAALVEAIGAHGEDRPIVAIGDGCAIVGAALLERFGARVSSIGPPAGTPTASAVGRLAVRMLARGAAIRAEALAPVYVRRAEAEVKRTGARFETPPGSRDAL